MDPKEPKITPYQLGLFTEPVTDIYRALEEQIFLLVAKRLKTNPEHGKDHVLQWQVDKMQQLRMLNKETIQELSKATGLATDSIEKAVADVGLATVKTVDGELQTVYPILPTPSQIDVTLEAFVLQTFREIDNFVNQTLISTNYGEGTVARMYRKIIEETTAMVLSGTMTINKAVTETIIRWGNKGVDTAFVDKGGNVWTLERYTDTVIRSTVNRTYNEMRMSRMQEYGVDLVLVSSHAAARPICSQIQGRVASMSNPSSNPDYPSIYNYGYGTPGGIRGINCKHLFYPFIEGLNTNNQIQYDLDEVDKGYKLTQQQRYYERQIRKAKRSLNLAEELGDQETIERYKKLVRNRQATVREFIAKHELPRFYEKERVITQ